MENDDQNVQNSPVIPPAPTAKKSPTHKGLMAIIILALVAGTAVWVYFILNPVQTHAPLCDGPDCPFGQNSSTNKWISQQATSTSAISTSTLSSAQSGYIPHSILFVAKDYLSQDDKTHTLDIIFYDAKNNKTIFSKNIPMDDQLSAGSMEAEYANNSAQYNESTGDLFFSTQGSSEYDGSCMNKDGTCSDRIYKFNVNTDTKPSIIYQPQDRLFHWIIDKFNNSIYLSFENFNSTNGTTSQVIKKIDFDGKNEQTVFTQNYNQSVGFGKLVLSADGKILYQAADYETKANYADTNITLNEIDLNSYALQKINIFQSQSQSPSVGSNLAEWDTTISPDDKYFAYYGGNAQNSTLFIYNVATTQTISVPYQGTIGNYTLVWSTDRKNLIYETNSQINSYNIDSQKSTAIGSSAYPLSASEQFVLYVEGAKNSMAIFDLLNGTQLSLPDYFNQVDTTIADSQWISQNPLSIHN